MSLKTIFRLWLPLAISFELMMLEGPAIQGALGRLPFAQHNLAAMGLTMSLALLIESPVIMLLATAIALVKDRDSYLALRRFTLLLCAGCTLLAAAVAFTPLYDVVTLQVMGQPVGIAARARPALQILLFWTAAIGWRRFYQGVLVSQGQTRLVSYGTAVRLTAAVTTVLSLAAWGHLPGVQVGACALMAAVLAEAAMTTRFALPLVRREVLPRLTASPPLTQPRIWRFHAPLAATTLLTLLAQPLTSAFLARLPDPHATLAAWPVASMALLVIRGWGLALQEITVAQANDAQATPALNRFALWVGGISSGVTLLLVSTPLLDLYFRLILHLPAALRPYAWLGVALSVPLPLFTALGAWARGLRVAQGDSRAAYRGMVVNLGVNGGLLGLALAVHASGIVAAAASITLAATAEFAYLSRPWSLAGKRWPVPIALPEPVD